MFSALIILPDLPYAHNLFLLSFSDLEQLLLPVVLVNV